MKSFEKTLDSHKKSIDSIWTVIQLHPEHDLSDDTVSNGFMKELNEHLQYLGPLKSASVRMQKYLATQDNCQFQCNVIAELAKDGYSKRQHDFQYCK